MAEIDTRRRLGHAICPGKLIRCVRSACCVYLLLSWKVDVCIQRNAHVPFFASCGAQIGCGARDRRSGHVLQTALADAKSAEHVEHVVFQKSVFLFYFFDLPLLFFCEQLRHVRAAKNRAEGINSCRTYREAVALLMMKDCWTKTAVLANFCRMTLVAKRLSHANCQLLRTKRKNTNSNYRIYCENSAQAFDLCRTGCT